MVSSPPFPALSLPEEDQKKHESFLCESATHYSVENNIDKLCEELMELGVALQHYKRNRIGAALNLASEMADVLLMIDLVRYQLYTEREEIAMGESVTPSELNVLGQIQYKMQRSLERIVEERSETKEDKA
tara:strand:+ start:916 stop:1308 length:393 start_codon:yes stop_codon:yes gene_type:complete